MLYMSCFLSISYLNFKYSSEKVMDFKSLDGKSKLVLKMSITLKVGTDFARKFGIGILMKIMYE